MRSQSRRGKNDNRKIAFPAYYGSKKSDKTFDWWSAFI